MNKLNFAPSSNLLTQFFIQRTQSHFQKKDRHKTYPFLIFFEIYYATVEDSSVSAGAFCATSLKQSLQYTSLPGTGLKGTWV